MYGSVHRGCFLRLFPSSSCAVLLPSAPSGSCGCPLHYYGAYWVHGVRKCSPNLSPEPALAALSNGLMRSVEGDVIDAGPVREEPPADPVPNQQEGPSQRIDLRLSTIEVVSDTEDTQTPALGIVRVTVRWPPGKTKPAGFDCGQRIRADARLMLPDVYRDPGAWNYRDYLLDQGITSTATVKSDRVNVLDWSGEKSFACRVSGWQHAASAKLLALPSAMYALPSALRLSDDDAIMLAAMATGDRTYLTHSLRAGFERTGSFHMLVVSGLHLGIVAACIFWITRRLRLPQFPATLITIAGSFAYAILTGFATPVQRSLWMVTLYLVGRLIYRQRNVLNTIGFAALCLIATSPRSLFESSLQMTVLAVISIGGVAVPLLEKTVHPYLTATRDLRLLALDVKLPAREAQFRVMLRMLASALARAFGKPIGWKLFPWSVRVAVRCFEALVVSCIVELAMTSAHGALLPSHHGLRIAGKHDHPAAARGTHSQRLAHPDRDVFVANGCCYTGHTDRCSFARRSGTHSSLRSYQDRRFSHSCASAAPGSGFLPSGRRISMACARWQSRTIKLVAPCCRHRDDCRCSRRGTASANRSPS